MTRHTLHARMVTTFEVDGWPVGVLTGRADGDIYVLEHVICFSGAPPFTMLAMLRDGVAEAWAQHFSSIVFCLPDDFPPRRALGAAGARLGFEPYAHTEGVTWFVLHKS